MYIIKKEKEIASNFLDTECTCNLSPARVWTELGSQLEKLLELQWLLVSPCELLLTLVSRGPAWHVGEGMEVEVELRKEGLVLREGN